MLKVISTVKGTAKSSVKAPSGLTSGPRLAHDFVLSGCLYNAYQYVTQMTGLYTQAEQLYKPEKHGSKNLEIWRDLSGRALGDLGAIYSLWDSELRGAREVQAQDLAKYIGRSCAHADRLARLLSLWEPVHKWTLAMVLCEKRLKKFLLTAEMTKPSLKEQVLPLQKHCEERLAILQTLLLEQARHVKAMHDSFLVRQEKMV